MGIWQHIKDKVEHRVDRVSARTQGDAPLRPPSHEELEQQFVQRLEQRQAQKHVREGERTQELAQWKTQIADMQQWREQRQATPSRREPVAREIPAHAHDLAAALREHAAQLRVQVTTREPERAQGLER